MKQDHEITALSNVVEALKGLEKMQIRRIIDWITDRFITGAGAGVEAPLKTQKAPVFTEPGQADETGTVTGRGRGRRSKKIPVQAKEIRGRRGRKPREILPQEPEAPAEEMPTEVRGPHYHVVIKRDKGDFMQYENLAEVFREVKLKSVAQKVLLAAAFMQERKGIREMTSFDVTSGLKGIGQKVKNASLAINGMIKQDPALLIQKAKMGHGKMARKIFSVTAEGIEKARNFLKG